MAPFDLIKVRLQNQTEARAKPGSPPPRYRGPVHCAASIFQEEGPRGLFRGAWALTLRDTPTTGIDPRRGQHHPLSILSSLDSWKAPRQLPCPWAVPNLYCFPQVPYSTQALHCLLRELRVISFNLLKIIIYIHSPLAPVRTRDVPSPVHGSSLSCPYHPLARFPGISSSAYSPNPTLVTPGLSSSFAACISWPLVMLQKPPCQGHQGPSHLSSQFLFPRNSLLHLARPPLPWKPPLSGFPAGAPWALPRPISRSYSALR